MYLSRSSFCPLVEWTKLGRGALRRWNMQMPWRNPIDQSRSLSLSLSLSLSDRAATTATTTTTMTLRRWRHQPKEEQQRHPRGESPHPPIFSQPSSSRSHSVDNNQQSKIIKRSATFRTSVRAWIDEEKKMKNKLLEWFWALSAVFLSYHFK